MFALSIQRRFEARHYLQGGDWGPENEPHSHNYKLELELAGEKLDKDGFLINIIDLEKKLDEFLETYRNNLLNDLPLFDGKNPSLENFAQILATSLASHLEVANLASIRIRLWESESAWASYHLDL